MQCEVNLLGFMSLQGKRTPGSDCATSHWRKSAVLIHMLRSARSPCIFIQHFLQCVSKKLNNQDRILPFYLHDCVNQSERIKQCLEPETKSRQGPVIATVVCKSWQANTREPITLRNASVPGQLNGRLHLHNLRKVHLWSMTGKLLLNTVVFILTQPE